MYRLIIALLVTALMSLGWVVPGWIAGDEVTTDNSAKAQFEFDVPQTEDEPLPPGDDEPRFEMADLGPQ